MSGDLPTSKCIGGTAVDGCRWSWWLLHLPMLPSIPQGTELIYGKCEEYIIFEAVMVERALIKAWPSLASFMLSFLFSSFGFGF